MADFDITVKNRVKRVAKRGAYDKKAIYEIVDESLIGHVGFIIDNEPYVIPTLIARQDDRVLLHGASSSRLMRYMQAGGAVSISVTHVDALVLARSVFHHSLNYRSAILYGRGVSIDDPAAKMEALRVFTDQLLPGRWQDARTPNEAELKATAVVAVPIDLASAKIRTGPAIDDEEDYALPVWAGVVPIDQVYGDPIPDDRLDPDTVVPDYLIELVSNT